MTQLARSSSESPQNLVSVLQIAYERLRKNELVVLCTIRSLQTSGSPAQLAKRLAEHEIQVYQPSQHVLESILPEISPLAITRPPRPSSRTQHLTSSLGAQLPLELVVEIIDFTGDWELAKALGLPTTLPRPIAWSRATRLDLAILSLHLPTVQHTPGPFYHVSAKAAIRFGAVNIIDWLFRNKRENFDKIFAPLLAATASAEGSIAVLEWYKANYAHTIRGYGVETMDNASLQGQVQVLEWWRLSGLPLKYSSAALEHASSRGHLDVLDWWMSSGLQLKIGRVMELASGAGQTEVLSWWHQSGLEYKYDKSSLYNASCSGHVDSLNWWAESGLHLIYDPDVLVGATRNNRPEVLEWWDRSNLPVQYRLCDIEEALEDAMGGGKNVRKWWEKKGVDFRASFTEWTKYQSLH